LSKESKQIHQLTVNGKTWAVTEPEKHGLTQKIKVNEQVLSVRILREPTTDQPDLVANINGKVLIARRKEDRDGSGYLIRLNGRLLKVALGGIEPSSQNAGISEAMKMENEIAAPKTGIVKEVYVQSGALVKAGDKLCLLE
jgi:biotin carboxyl carrier protein